MLLHKNHKFIYDNLATGTLQFHTVPHRATTCHFFAIFRKNHHFSQKTRYFYTQKRQDARPVFSLFFIQIISPATYCGCKDIYRYRL